MRCTRRGPSCLLGMSTFLDGALGPVTLRCRNAGFVAARREPVRASQSGAGQAGDGGSASPGRSRTGLGHDDDRLTRRQACRAGLPGLVPAFASCGQSTIWSAQPPASGSSPASDALRHGPAGSEPSRVRRHLHPRHLRLARAPAWVGGHFVHPYAALVREAHSGLRSHTHLLGDRRDQRHDDRLAAGTTFRGRRVPYPLVARVAWLPNLSFMNDTVWRVPSRDARPSNHRACRRRAEPTLPRPYRQPHRHAPRLLAQGPGAATSCPCRGPGYSQRLSPRISPDTAAHGDIRRHKRAIGL